MVVEQEVARPVLSRRARKRLGRAASNGVDPGTIRQVAGVAIRSARSQQLDQVTADRVTVALETELRVRLASPINQNGPDLRSFDLKRRRSEHSEIFDPQEADTYITGCDYPETADELLLAWEIARDISPSGLRDRRVLDAMCGPGRLGRELLGLGATSVVFHDGDEKMTTHALEEASKIAQPGQTIEAVTSNADHIPLPDHSVDLVVCHNSTHQLSSMVRLGKVLREFVRITRPGGQVRIADYQRSATPEFLALLQARLQYTRPEIVPLLLPSFMAAFSKNEFSGLLKSMSDIRSWDVYNAPNPQLTPAMQQRVDMDPVRGHVMDYGPISLRAVIQK